MPLAEALTHSLSLSSIPSVPRDIAQPLPSSPVVRVSNFTGPLLNETLGDLSILKAGGKYYAFASHSGLHGPGAFKNVPTAVSDSLTEGWQPGPDAMKNGVGSWTIDPKGPGAALWNPDVSQLVRTLPLIIKEKDPLAATLQSSPADNLLSNRTTAPS